jgi:hypothetical protein
LRKLRRIAGRLAPILVLAVAGLAAADPPASPTPPSNFARTLDVAGSRMDFHFDSAAAAPGATAVAGVGSVGATLPFDTQLTVRMPATFGEHAVMGDAQVAASYPLVDEGELLPKVSVLAQVALPTAPGSRVVLPGVKATAEKKLFFGDLHAETELRTDGRELARSYRTAVGARVRLRPKTSATLDLVTLRPSGHSLLPRDDHAQLGLCQELAPGTRVRLGVGAGVTGGQSSLRSSLGLDLRF